MLTKVKVSEELKIDEAIFKETTKCTKLFACISGNGYECCTIKECISSKVHFLMNGDQVVCPYIIGFANEHICTCPIRMEIYNVLKR